MRKHTEHMPKDVKAVGIGLLVIYIGACIVIVGIPAAILLIAFPQLWFLIAIMALLVIGGYIKGK